jgi:NAD(P)-dependent dehydrogenase (short-subunit alcohol dehydrogenase family)
MLATLQNQVVVITGASSGIGRAASKFAIRALSESLRQEIEVLDKADIHICTIMPATIDTPFFRHAANFTGRVVKAMPPVYPPEKVALTMISLAEHPRREIFVGNAARLIGFTHSFAPALAEPLVAKQIETMHFLPDRAPSTLGSTLVPMETGTAPSDGWEGAEKQATRSRVSISIAVAAAGLTTLFGWLMLRKNQMFRRISSPIGL